MEINFQLDSDGRTSYAISESDSDVCQGQPLTLDYSSKVQPTGLSNVERPLPYPVEDILDDLIFDCEILDFAILPRTFWIPAAGKV